MAFTSAKDAVRNDKCQLYDALEEMRANACDPQRVYSCLVSMFDTLAASAEASRARSELLVDAVLAPASNVKALQEVMVFHVSQEEIQWYLCRFLTLACTHSLRFQCQAGQLALWSDIFQARSTHPGSMRILETSLHSYEALLNGNELQVLKVRPAQKLIQEMLTTIDRFACKTTSTGKSRSCEEFRPEMVIGALRLLTTIYSSPRIQLLVEEKNAQFAEAIISRLISTFTPIFLRGALDDVKLWLRMCLLQTQQHRDVAIPELFLLTYDARRYGKSSKPWFVLLLEKWSDNPMIVYDFLVILTHVFALPHKLGEYLEALTRELLDNHKLLGTLCELLAKYNDTVTQGEQQQASYTGEYHLTLTLLEIIRVLRQWSVLDTTLRSFASCSQVNGHLIPTLITQLHASTEQIQASHSSSTRRQQALQIALEISILLQKLTQVSGSFKSTLMSSKALQATVHELRKNRTAPVSSSSSTVAASHDHASKSDTDLDVLVKREATKLAQLLVTPVLDPRQSSAAKMITSSRQLQQPSTRLMLTKPGFNPTRGSTRQISSSTSVAVRELRSSCSSMKL